MINLKAGYRHYNQWIDVIFWILLFGYARGLLLMAGFPRDYLLAEWRPFHVGLGIIVMIAHVVMSLLIMMRSLRDEYAEILWQKSAASFVNLLPAAPLLWIAVNIAFADFGGWLNWLRANPEYKVVPDHAVFPNPSGSIGLYQYEAINFTITKLTQYFPIVFAGLYKWHRWRDGQ